MNIRKHLVPLLFAHDCVIVPGFGGFIADYVPARIDTERHMVYPPSKNLVFNALLKKNDGLLASYIATTERIGYSDAYRSVEEFVKTCTGKLERDKRIVIDEVGLFYLDAGSHIHFRPDATANFLRDAYGLAPVPLRPAEDIAAGPLRIAAARRSAPRPRTLRAGDWVPIAALLALTWMIPSLVPKIDTAISSFAPAPSLPAVQREATPETGEIAKHGGDLFWLGSVTGPADTMAGDTMAAVVPAVVPADSVEAHEVPPADAAPPRPAAGATPAAGSVARPEAVQGGAYHIIVGCFGVTGNAERMTDDLRRRGYPAGQAGLNRAGLTMVSASSYPTLTDAEAALEGVRRDVIATAWILRKAD